MLRVAPLRSLYGIRSSAWLVPLVDDEACLTAEVPDNPFFTFLVNIRNECVYNETMPASTRRCGACSQMSLVMSYWCRNSVASTAVATGVARMRRHCSTVPHNLEHASGSAFWCDVGRQDYMRVLAWQQGMVADRLAAIAGQKAVSHNIPDVFIAVEHDPVYTLGRGAKLHHLNFELDTPPLPIHRVERGGEVTYHGPGQAVVYPVLNLSRHKQDLRWYVTLLEDVIIATLGHWGLPGHRMPTLPGVWVGGAKVAQVGIAASKWHTWHGIAVNVHPDMAHFEHIVPCGISEHPVTSMHRLLAASCAPADTKPPLPTVQQVHEQLQLHFAHKLRVKMLHPDAQQQTALLGGTAEGAGGRA